MIELINTTVITDNDCLGEYEARFMASVEEVNELSDALDIVSRWERKAQTALGTKLVSGEISETSYQIDFPNVITVKIRTGSIG